MMQAEPPRFLLATAPAPGAIAIVQVMGPGAAAVVERLTGRRPKGRFALCDFAGIDEGLAVALNDQWCELMPHGGPRVVQRLREKLIELGARPASPDDLSAREIYPEAPHAVEAWMLAALARGASPAAIDPLLDQPARWAKLFKQNDWPRARMLEKAHAGRHLLSPPTVALVGPANVGKSTLTNLIMGRAAAIVADLPGTTRDWVGGLAEIPTPSGELAVRWIDTPGRRVTDDAIERSAIALSDAVIADADVIITVREPGAPPLDHDFGDTPTLALLNKADLPHADPTGDEIPISALKETGLDELGLALLDRLGLSDFEDETPWPFCQSLRDITEASDRDALARALAGPPHQDAQAPDQDQPV